MPRGEVCVSPDLLVVLLNLEQHGYKGVVVRDDAPRNRIVLEVEHPDLPEPKDGKLPRIIATYRTVTTPNGQVWAEVDKIEVLF